MASIRSLLLVWAAMVVLSAAPPLQVSIATAGPRPELNNGEFELLAPGEDSKRVFDVPWSIVRSCFHRAGYTIRLELVPWVRAMALAQSGHYEALYPAGKNPEREAHFLYSSNPINQINYVLYVSEIGMMKNAKSLGDFHGKRIAVMRTWEFGPKWRAAEGIEKVTLNTPDQAFEMLAANRVDAIVGYDVNFDRIIANKGIVGVKKTPPFDYALEYLILPKNNSNSEQIIRAFDEAYLQLKRMGQLPKLSPP